MKKLIFAIAAILLLAACSDEENVASEIVSDGLLLKKVTMTTNELSSNFYYNYDGNKLVSESHEGKGIIKYFYTGDLITRIEDYDADNTTLLSVRTNSYDGLGRLISTQLQYEFDDEKSRTVYVYNDDDTIQTDSFVAQVDAPEQHIASGKYHVGSNGEIMEIGDNSGNIGIIYEYDTNKNPLKNVTGFSKLLQYNIYGRFANVTKIVYNLPENATSTTTISYAYNASGFPKKANFNLNGTVYTKEFFYE